MAAPLTWARIALLGMGLIPACLAASITWQPVRDAAGDTDVVAEGRVIRAYSFASGNRPTVHGVAFTDFSAQSADVQTFNGGFKGFYANPAFSADYNQLLTGGMQDTAHLDAPAPQRLTLKGLIPTRQYRVQLWVADNRTWSGLEPAFSSASQTVCGSDADVNVPTLRWQGGNAHPTAQHVVGTFTADRKSQTLTFTPTEGFFNGTKWFTSQINAVVLSDISPGVPAAAIPDPAAAAAHTRHDRSKRWTGSPVDEGQQVIEYLLGQLLARPAEGAGCRTAGLSP